MAWGWSLADTVPSSDSSTDKEYVEELTATLNPEEQMLIQMHIEGCRGDEIAEALGLKCNAVYQRLRRSISKARKVLLALMLSVLASNVAIAVEPLWRKAIFYSHPLADTLPEAKPSLTDFNRIKLFNVVYLISSGFFCSSATYETN